MTANAYPWQVQPRECGVQNRRVVLTFLHVGNLPVPAPIESLPALTASIAEFKSGDTMQRLANAIDALKVAESAIEQDAISLHKATHAYADTVESGGDIQSAETAVKQARERLRNADARRVALRQVAADIRERCVVAFETLFRAEVNSDFLSAREAERAIYAKIAAAIGPLLDELAAAHQREYAAKRQEYPPTASVIPELPSAAVLTEQPELPTPIGLPPGLPGVWETLPAVFSGPIENRLPEKTFAAAQ